MIFIKKHTKDLIKDLVNNYSDWVQKDAYLQNIITDKKIWTGNGTFFIDFYPNITAFNIVEKYFVHRAVFKNNVLNALKRS